MLLVIAGIGLSSALIGSVHHDYQALVTKRHLRTKISLGKAKQALETYLLLRADNPLPIFSGSAQSVQPRLLMLPCPDNVGDRNLDGSQDPHCGSKVRSAKNVVNDILDSGSRFGRLPWRIQIAVSGSKKRQILLQDGIGSDFRDVSGHRFWYALSRNVAPIKNEALPLNFHRLLTLQDEWLKVVDGNGHVINRRVAAVVLSPGKGRMAEEILLTTTVDYRRDVRPRSGFLSPTQYFDLWRHHSHHGVVLSNADRDGVFVHAPAQTDFDDQLAYIGIDSLVSDSSTFFPAYKRLLGITSVHNRVLPHTRLAHLRAALQAYVQLAGFYPLPARQRTLAHVTTRQRSCAQYHSGAHPLTVTLPAATALIAPAPVPITALVSGHWRAQQNAAWLLTQRKTVTPTDVAQGVHNDVTVALTEVSLARYSRVTIPIAVVSHALATTSVLSTVAAGATVSLAAAAVAIIAPRTPLTPSGHLLGWLPEYTNTVTVSKDGTQLSLTAPTRAMFLSPAVMTNAHRTVILTAEDSLLLLTTSVLRIEKDFDDIKPLDVTVWRATGESFLLTQALPTAPTYAKRQLVVWLLSDAVSKHQTVTAPAILFPWRQKTGDKVNTRDNLHPYPPCLDARNFSLPAFEAFLADQPMVYAVSAGCHYGATAGDCGQRGGLTVSVAAGVTVALPQPLTLTQSFIATLSRGVAITLVGGRTNNRRDLLLTTRARLPLPNASGQTIAFLQLAPQVVVSATTTLVIAADTPLVGTDNTLLHQVQALLIYSPAPLRQVACTAGMASTYVATSLTLADQTASATDITPLCYWLDDEENSDGDGLYVIHPPSRLRRNDVFMLFGGQLLV